MEYKSIKGFSGWGQLGMLFLFTGACFIVGAIIQLGMIMQMLPPGTSLTQPDAMQKALLAPQNVTMLRVAQVLGTFILLFLPAVIYSLVTNGRNKFWLGFNRYINIKQVGVGFVIIFAANIFSGPFADLSKAVVAHLPALDAIAKKLEDAYNEQVLAISNLKSWGEYLVAVVIMAFFPAMFEEVFFRGALQNLLVRWWKKPLLAIIVSSFVFSLIHMSVYLFLSRAILGFALGLMYHKSKNIWVNIIAHFLNNFIAVTVLFYMSMQKGKLDITKADPKVDWWVGLMALGGLIVLFRLFNKVSQNNVEKIMAQEAVIVAKEDPFRGFAETTTN